MDEKVVFGRNAVEEALRAYGRVNRLLLAKESRARWMDAVIDQARANKVRFHFVPLAKLNKITGTGDHQGIAAIVSPVTYISLEACLAGCPQQATLLALDQVQNPKNLGMLIRTALGAGVSGVLLLTRGGALLDDDVVRASAGAVFHVPVVYCANIAQALRRLRKAGFWVYGLDVQGEYDVFQVSWPDRTVLVLGNETGGLRPGVKKACDALVRIPMANNLNSLNVSVTGGISLFQVFSHRMRASQGTYGEKQNGDQPRSSKKEGAE